MLMLFMLLFYVAALVALLIYVIVDLWQSYTLYREERERKANYKRFKALYRVWKSKE